MPSEMQKMMQRQALKRNVVDQHNKIAGDNRARNLLENKVTILEYAANTGIPDSTYTPIHWDTVVSDDPGWFDPTADTRITVDYDGVYSILWVQVYNSADNTNHSFFRLYKNGSVAFDGNTAYAAIDANRIVTNERRFVCVAGDYFETYTWQNSGSTRTFGAIDSLRRPQFSVMKIA